MKAAIFTLIGAGNYGGELQNYAVQQVLKKINISSETVFKYTGCKRKFIYCAVAAKDIIRRIFNKSYGLYYRRERKFYNFEIQYILAAKYNHSTFTLSKNDYDYCIVGSDQVWNPYDRESFYLFTGMNCCKQYKKISFAASIGMDSIPSEDEKYFIENIQKFKAISVREKQAAVVIKQLTGIDAKVLCDPTLMLFKEEWDKISVVPSKAINKKYLLSYFLGDMDNDMRNRIMMLALKHDLEIVDISPKKKSRINPSDGRFYDVGPGEFVWLVFNAQIVCTDSFHGVAFSFIGNVDVCIFNKKYIIDVSSRIQNLLSELGCDKDYKYGVDLCKVDRDVMNEYSKHKLREAIEFLKKAMDIHE